MVVNRADRRQIDSADRGAAGWQMLHDPSKAILDKRTPSVRQLIILALASVSLPSVAHAQSAAPRAPQYSMPDERNVDMLTGQINLSDVTLSIGSKEQGLTYSRFWPGSGAWRHTYMMYIEGGDINGTPRIYVALGTSSAGFSLLNGSYVPDRADGSTLTENSTTYIYTDRDGVIYSFDKNIVGYSAYSMPINASATSIVRPDGVKIYLKYDLIAPSGGRYTGRLRSVENSFGYQLKFTYEAEAISSGEDHWRRIVKVQAINRAVDYCDANASTCTFTQPWPATLYSGSPDPSVGVEYVTDTAGRQWRFGYTTFYVGDSLVTNLQSIRRPGSTSDDLVYSYSGLVGYLSSVQSAGSGTWNYSISAGSWSSTPPNSATSRTLSFSTPPGTTNTQYILTDETGSATTLLYDNSHFLLKETLPEGNFNSFTYDARGNLTQVVRTPKTGSGLTATSISATYPATCVNRATCNKPDSVTDARGAVTNYYYNSNGLPNYVQAPAPYSGSPRPEVHYNYTISQARVKNSSGTVVDQGDVITLPTGTVTCTTAAWPCAASDQAVTQIAYPGTGPSNLLPQTTTQANASGTLSATTSYTYDAFGNPVTVTDPVGAVTSTSFAADRQPTATISPSPDGGSSTIRPSVRYSYNAQGLRSTTFEGYYNPATQTHTSVVTRSSSYDNLGRKTTESTSDGTSTLALTQFGYDPAGRPDCTAVRMNPAVYSALPASACTLGTQGAQGPDRISKVVYDPAGRLVQQRKAVGTADEIADVTYSYTPNGKQEYVIDANGNRARQVYDGFDRMAQWVFPSTTRPASYDNATPASALSSAGALNTADFEQYGYDANDNRTSLRKRDASTLTFSYDLLNRNTVKIVPERSGLASTHTRDVYYGYDLLGRQLYARFDSATGEGITNSYDALGRITATTQALDSASRTLNYQYDAASNRLRITHPDGVYFRSSYDGLGRLANAWWDVPSQAEVQFAAVSYDSAGRRSSINRASSWTDYGYDGMSRLNSLTQRFAGNVGNVTDGFTSNPASQIVQSTRSNDAFSWTGAVAVNRPYTANGLNQYTVSGAISIGYDANGNLTSDGSTSFTYDVENRLVSASGSKAAALRYDPLGHLYEVGGSSGTTRFLYDGDALVGEYATNGTLLRRYMWSPGVDQPILWDEGAALNCSGTKFLHPDQQGSIIALADCWGNRSAVNTYDEWGIPGANTGRFQYTGQAWLPELGMYHYKARIYSPTLGRFLQTDPIGYKDHVNLYAYVRNDPVNWFDPTGTDCDSPTPDNPCVTIEVNAGRTDPEPQTVEIDAVNTIEIGAGSGANANRGGAPQNPKPEQPSTVQCVGKALWDNKAVLALDGLSVAASFVPGGRGLLTAGASIVGSYTGVVALGLGVAGKDATGAIIGGSGHYVSVAAGLTDGAKGLAKNLPIAGQALAIGGAAYDVYSTVAGSGCFGSKK